MSVIPHTSRPGWWYIKISHGRKGKTEYIPYPGSKEEAEAYERQIRGLTDTTDPDFTEHLPDFFLWYKNSSRPRGYEVIENSFKHLKPFFGTFKLRYINSGLIEKYKEWRLEIGNVKQRTINIELNGLSKYLLSYLKEIHKIELDIKIKRFGKNLTQPPPKILLTPKEMTGTIGNLKGFRHIVIRLYAECGLRRDEPLTLTADNVMDSHKMLLIHGKMGKWREVAIASDDLWQEIMAHKEAALAMKKEDNPKRYLFLNPSTKAPYKNLKKSLKTAAKKANVGTDRVYNHLLRHSIATALDDSGASTRDIQLYLNHSDLATTQKYLHANRTRLRSTANKATSLLSLPKTEEKEKEKQ